MGTSCQVDMSAQKIDPVDATVMQEWEADTASHVAAGLLFWCWYLPSEMLGVRSRARAVLAPLARGRVLLRYPLYAAPLVRAVAAKKLIPR